MGLRIHGDRAGGGGDVCIHGDREGGQGKEGWRDVYSLTSYNNWL